MTRSFLRPIAVLFLGCVAPLAGCGDITSANGELGRARYSLHSDHLDQGADLNSASIITGHAQHISVSLTDMGSDYANGDDAQIVHSVDDDSVVLTNDDDNENVPHFSILGSEPGTVTVESTLAGEEFDRIDLTFDAPADLELLTRVRDPYADEFEVLPTGSVAVGEGSQVAILSIPLAGDGSRLVGQFDVEVTADPSWAVAPGYNVLGVYEQNLVGSSEPFSLYFIEPGPVTVTITDLANGVSVVRDFDVLPVDAT